jgi:hypothetical protein
VCSTNSSPCSKTSQVTSFYGFRNCFLDCSRSHLTSFLIHCMLFTRSLLPGAGASNGLGGLSLPFNAASQVWFGM